MAKANVKQKTPVIHAGETTAKFRTGSARELYYTRMGEFVGKPLADFVASVASNPPSMPTKGKLSGKQEPVQVWVNLLVRNGYYNIAA